MLRVLLAIEDYTELLYLQTLLKKIGFDVVGVQNERSLEETRLGLNPEVIIISARGRKLKGLEYALQSQKVRGIPKIIVIYASQREIESVTTMEPGVEGRLISPINPKTILSLLSRLGGLDGMALLEKYRRIKTSLSPEEKKILQRVEEEEGEGDDQDIESQLGGGSDQTPVAELSSRALRYKKFLESVEKPPSQSFDRSKIASLTKSARLHSDSEDEKKLNEEKQAFAKALFSKD